LSRKTLALFAAGLALIGIPLVILSVKVYRQGYARPHSERVIRLAGEDWGYPSPFQFYPRGPGFIQMSYIFDSLVWKDKEGLMGLLASSWKVSPDRMLYTFFLRQDVLWHDGARFTSNDVVFSVNYLKRNYYTWADLGIIDQVEALDEYRVEFQLTRPFQPFLVNVAGSFPIIPAHIWEKVENPIAFADEASIIGTGPYRLESYNRELGTYSYVANEKYFLGKPAIDRIEYVATGDQLLALQNRDIDALTLWSRNLDAVDQFLDDPRFRVIEGPGNWVLKLTVNLRNPLLSLRELRLALAHAIDLDEIAQRIRHGHVNPGRPGFLPPSSQWFNADLKGYEYDLDLARDELAKAGLIDRDGDGIIEDSKGNKADFTLLAITDYTREAEYISSQAAKIGIKIKTRILPMSMLDAFLEEGDYQLVINGHGGIGGDPDALRVYFCTDNAWSTTGYQNEMLAELGERELREKDPEIRRGLIHRMQEIIARDLPAITLWYPKIYLVYDPVVMDTWFWTPGGMSIGIPTFDNKLAYIERRI
jgi:peptide/nickel transport system substrate-binding protein